VVQLALKRLSPQLAYDRVFRLRRAFQVSASRFGLQEAEIDPSTALTIAHRPPGS
jgi:hypothetical protein